MALFNENRMRVPQVATLPSNGDDGGIRGQMRMIDTEGDVSILVCTTSDGGLPSALVVTAGTGNFTYTSVALGDDGALVSIEHVVSAAVTPAEVTVTGNAIVVTADAAAHATVVASIEASAEASALVTVVDNASSAFAVAAAANLTGGERTFATVTLDNVVYTAVIPGSAGNDITIVRVDDVLATEPTVTVDGTTITITEKVGEVNDVAAAVNAVRLARRLVTAVGVADAFAAGSDALTGGSTTALWTAMAVA